MCASLNFDKFICIYERPRTSHFSVGFDWLYRKQNLVTIPSHAHTCSPKYCAIFWPNTLLINKQEAASTAEFLWQLIKLKSLELKLFVSGAEQILKSTRAEVHLHFAFLYQNTVNMVICICWKLHRRRVGRPILVQLINMFLVLTGKLTNTPSTAYVRKASSGASSLKAKPI